jgi:hypothetical protein
LQESKGNPQLITYKENKASTTQQAIGQWEEGPKQRAKKKNTKIAEGEPLGAQDD